MPEIAPLVEKLTSTGLFNIALKSRAALLLLSLAACGEPVCYQFGPTDPNNCTPDEYPSDGSGAHQPKDEEETPAIPPAPLCEPMEEGTERTFFVTSFLVQGDFGGIEIADQYCNDAAEAAGRPEHYVAWLGDSETGLAPATRKEFCSIRQFEGPIMNTRNQEHGGPEVLAEGWTDLTENGVSAMFYDESGLPPASGEMWSNTTKDGFSMGADCAGWISAEEYDEGWSGANGIKNLWLANRKIPCDEVASLGCISTTPPLELGKKR